jgi:hypothetical protein
MIKEIKWLEQPEEHDYPAAESYLTLLFTPNVVSKYVHLLRCEGVREFKAKDILRASKLSPLGMHNKHVEKNTRKIEDGKSLSPILLVRDSRGLVVADGYHRLCAIYLFNEDAIIKCKII